MRIKEDSFAICSLRIFNVGNISLAKRYFLPTALSVWLVNIALCVRGLGGCIPSQLRNGLEVAGRVYVRNCLISEEHARTPRGKKEA